jgi:subtilisin family serine protease
MSRARARRLALALAAIAALATTANAGSGPKTTEHDARLAASGATEALESFILSFPDAPEPETADLDRALDELPSGCRVRRLRRTLRGAVLRMRASQARAFAEKYPRAHLERDALVTAQGFRTSARNPNESEVDTETETGFVTSFASTLGDGDAEGDRNDEKGSSVSATSLRAFEFDSERPLHWGVDRVNQRRLPLDGRTSRDRNAGANTILYVVDSGVFSSHDDFTNEPNRVVTLFDAVSGFPRTPQDGFQKNHREDCYGHGTAVASLAAGARGGLAPSASIVSIRVLDCNGNGLVSDVVSGLETAAEHFEEVVRAATARTNLDDAHATPPKAALTLSLGVPAGRASRSLDLAVQSMMEQRGMSVFAAAGNSEGSARRDDACGFSPGRVADCVTVGASDATDRAWIHGMSGRCVDVYAPGVSVLGASHEYRDVFVEWTGTSMAAPIVAGAAMASGAAGKEVVETATKGVLWDEPGDREGDGERWGSNRFGSPRPGRVLHGTPNKLVFLGAE